MDLTCQVNFRSLQKTWKEGLNLFVIGVLSPKSLKKTESGVLSNIPGRWHVERDDKQA